MATISIQELAKIPYLDVRNLHGRTISTLTFHDADEWHFWLPLGDTLVKIQGTPGEGLYYGREPESLKDVRLHFLDFIAQRACWHPVAPVVLGLRNDFLNLSASLKKFEILFDASKMHGVATSRLVITELEYLFSLCRSVFDLLQEVISAQWSLVRLRDESIKKKQLPKTFSKIALDGKRARDEDALMLKFNIPKELAEFYVRATSFFLLLKAFRDKFIHGGTTIDMVFVTERGFAVQSSTRPFSDFGIWNDEQKLPNDLCSLRPAIFHMVNETLRTCDDYAKTMQRIVEYSPPMVPGFSLYMRGYFTDLLHTNERVLSECHWWGDVGSPLNSEGSS